MFSKRKKKSYSAALYESNEPTGVIPTMDPHKFDAVYLGLTKKKQTSNLNLYATDYKGVDV